MKLFFMMLSFLFISVSFAGGTKDSGGDPMVQQFLDMGHRLSQYFSLNPYKADLGFDPKKFQEIIVDLDQSIKDEAVEDKLEFTSLVLKDSSGVEKPAIFNSVGGSIKVNRECWTVFTKEQRLIQVALEVTGLMDLESRYEIVGRLLENKAQFILAMNITSARRDYTLPGWSIVGQDPGQFAKITSDQVLLDGGVLGTGAQNLASLLQFFNNPFAHQDWMAQIDRGWKEDHRFYLLLHTPAGNWASVSSFYVTRDDQFLYFNIYTLVFEARGPIFREDCRPEVRQIDPLTRLKQCYLDQNLYYPNDSLVVERVELKNLDMNKLELGFKKSNKKFEQVLVNKLAKSTTHVSGALRDYFLTDYSKVMWPAYFQKLIQLATLDAHYIDPSLVGPFAETPFWMKSGTRELRPSSTKLFKAAKLMAENNLVFDDVTAQCNSLDEEHGELSGPFVINKYLYQKYLQAQKCMHVAMLQNDVEETLYGLLENLGYRFKQSTAEWGQ